MKPQETKSTVLLKHHLKALKLPTMHSECEKVASRCAGENVDHLGFLLQLCELERIDREKRAAERRLKAAKFPNTKTLESFDFTAQPSINKQLVTELMRGASRGAPLCSSKEQPIPPTNCSEEPHYFDLGHQRFEMIIVCHLKSLPLMILASPFLAE